MPALNETLAKRIANLFRRLNSEFEGEILAAVGAMKRLFGTTGLSFNDFATVIESCNGELEERRFSDADAQAIFARGVAKGRAEEARSRPSAGPGEYYDADGQPNYHAMAMHCQQHIACLPPRHHEFIDKMASSTLYREPTPAQGKYLLSLFIQLGGGRR